MSTAPFDVGPIIQRLRTRLVVAGGMRLVGNREDFSAVRSLADFPAPCAYVLLATEKAVKTDPGQSIPGQQTDLGQTMRVGVGIAMAFQNYRGLEGDELRDELRDRVGQVRNQLLGWTPPAAGAKQMQLDSGDLEDYDANVALWADKWVTQHFIQPEIP